MEEFSNSRHGQRLLDAVARTSFLRPVPGDESTAITRALEIAADLYHLDHYVIGPALSWGAVVLKDRHRDTNLYTVAPTLLASGAMNNETTALNWLSSLNTQLTHAPNLTVYVDAPLRLRIERIRRRQRTLVEGRAQDVSNEDIQVFQQRGKIAKWLIVDDPGRHMVLYNDDIDVINAASHIIATAQQLGPRRATNASAHDGNTG